MPSKRIAWPTWPGTKLTSVPLLWPLWKPAWSSKLRSPASQ
jgi:hypothetical protein